MKRESVKAGRGASVAKVGTLTLLNGWWGSHVRAIAESLVRLAHHPIQTVMTCLLVAIALALPAILLVGLTNFQSSGVPAESKSKISVFLKLQVPDEAVKSLAGTIQAWPEVQSVTLISPDQALAQFLAASGLGTVLDALDENPLPATLIVTPADEHVNQADLQRLGERIRQFGTVETIQIDLDWLKKLNQIMVVSERVILTLATLLSLGVLLAIGNSIRLEVENRREEIIVIKLVGGTDAFVRRPFVYAGAWYGLIGGILAVALVGVCYAVLQPSVAKLGEVYGSELVLRGLGIDGAGNLLLISTLLGFCGAWWTVSAQLSDIEPR